jgi:secondary thiamine-phosphate synthase enzyme
MMKSITVQTQREQELIDITPQVERAVRGLGLSEGACMLYVPHTTAGITINENADPAVKEDILDALVRLVPKSLDYKHLEGNAHAHIQSTLVGHSVVVPIEGGKPRMGTWQGVLFCEFDGPRKRTVWVIPLG